VFRDTLAVDPTCIWPIIDPNDASTNGPLWEVPLPTNIWLLIDRKPFIIPFDWTDRECVPQIFPPTLTDEPTRMVVREDTEPETQAESIDSDWEPIIGFKQLNRPDIHVLSPNDAEDWTNTDLLTERDPLTRAEEFDWISLPTNIEPFTVWLHATQTLLPTEVVDPINAELPIDISDPTKQSLPSEVEENRFEEPLTNKSRFTLRLDPPLMSSEVLIVPNAKMFRTFINDPDNESPELAITVPPTDNDLFPTISLVVQRRFCPVISPLTLRFEPTKPKREADKTDSTKHELAVDTCEPTKQVPKQENWAPNKLFPPMEQSLPSLVPEEILHALEKITGLSTETPPLTIADPPLDNEPEKLIELDPWIDPPIRQSDFPEIIDPTHNRSEKEFDWPKLVTFPRMDTDWSMFAQAWTEKSAQIFIISYVETCPCTFTGLWMEHCSPSKNTAPSTDSESPIHIEPWTDAWFPTWEFEARKSPWTWESPEIFMSDPIHATPVALKIFPPTRASPRELNKDPPKRLEVSDTNPNSPVWPEAKKLLPTLISPAVEQVDPNLAISETLILSLKHMSLETDTFPWKTHVELTEIDPSIFKSDPKLPIPEIITDELILEIPAIEQVCLAIKSLFETIMPAVDTQLPKHDSFFNEREDLPTRFESTVHEPPTLKSDPKEPVCLTVSESLISVQLAILVSPCIFKPDIPTMFWFTDNEDPTPMESLIDTLDLRITFGPIADNPDAQTTDCLIEQVAPIADGPDTEKDELILVALRIDNSCPTTTCCEDERGFPKTDRPETLKSDPALVKLDIDKICPICMHCLTDKL
jgi:hypothetical protein